MFCHSRLRAAIASIALIFCAIGVSTTSAGELSPSQELVFVADDVDAVSVLLAGLSPRAEIVHVRRDADLISSVTAALEGRRDVRAIHLVTHGVAGALRLGSNRVDREALEGQSHVLESWQGALSVDADILVYGCNVGEGRNGRLFVETLASLTGANVAASSGPTGGAVGADWELETRSGTVQTPTAFDVATRRTWKHALIAVTEPPDHSQTPPGTAHTLTLGSNTISGRVETPGDTQDNFRVTVPAGLVLTGVSLDLDTSGGFDGFVTWNVSETRTSSGSFSSGLPAGPGTYSVQVAANFSVGNDWSMTFTLVEAECAVAAECSDGIACTSDVCNSGICNNPPKAAGTACGDASNDTCTNPDTCDGAGACVPNHAANGTSCQAGAFCTSGDVCSGGVCVEGVAATCQAGDKCDEAGDVCFAACGDGVLDAGEECDDGGDNSDTAPDACRTDCTLAECGDSVVDSAEACDTGGNSATCDADCSLAACNDGVFNSAAEACDTGGNSASCDADCTLPACNDGVFNSVVEACDTGGNSASCDADCSAPACNDGVFNSAAEPCDDGNIDNTDGCSNTCELAVCGDGFVRAGVEDCDDGGVDSATCNADCSAATCGDSYVNTVAGEDCDDAGVDSAACDDDCSAATCGDSYVNEAAGEECDDGNTIDTDVCRNSCVDGACGDAVVLEGVEECDDGNSSDGDACNAICGLDSDLDSISDADEVDDVDLETPASDTDGDGTGDYLDDDSDGDGILDSDEAGDADLDTVPVDTDGDSTPDYRDTDSDDDGVSDADESGDADPTTPPMDTDQDGEPDILDADSDDDDIEDGRDNCRLVGNGDQEDANGDGIGNACQDDDDGDGVPDASDNCQLIANEQVDTDGDGAGDRCDGDADGDGFEDDLRAAGSGCGCSAGAGNAAGLAPLMLLGLLGLVTWRRRSFKGVSGKAGALLVVLLGGASTGAAQEFREISVERFRPAMDSGGVLNIESGSTPGHMKLQTSVFFSGEADLVTIERQRDDTSMELGALLAHRVGAELGVALGLGSRLEIGASIPVVFSQGAEEIPGTPAGGLAGEGIGDARLAGKYQLLRRSSAGLDLAILPAVTVPTATAEAFFGERSATAGISVAGSRRFGAVSLAANAGFLARKNITLANRQVGDELSFGVGASYDVARGTVPVTLMGALHGATAAASPFADSRETPVEALGAVRLGIFDGVALFAGGGAGVTRGLGAPTWRALLGLRYRGGASGEEGTIVRDQDGDGITDDADACPALAADIDGNPNGDGCPEDDDDGDGIAGALDRCPDAVETANSHQDEDGCPDQHADADGDGIRGAADQCPDAAEDVDGLADEDGCFEGDHDGDGIVDPKDGCPDVAETLNQVEDQDGCPDTQVDVQTLMPPPIEFAQGESRLLASSDEALDLVAKVMEEHDEILVLEVQGHASEDGPDDFNMELSQRRADAVVEALVRRGVSRDRLRAKGYGSTMQLASGDGEDARRHDRRVQFVVNPGE